LGKAKSQQTLERDTLLETRSDTLDCFRLPVGS
jgi:hypothetical protein